MRPSALLSAFIGVSAYHIPLTPPTAQNLLSSRRCTTIHACDASDSGPDPEEWRAFRAKLISGGIKTTDDGTGETATPSEPAERQSVAPENEELLKSQNEAEFENVVNKAHFKTGLLRLRVKEEVYQDNPRLKLAMSSFTPARNTMSLRSRNGLARCIC